MSVADVTLYLATVREHLAALPVGQVQLAIDELEAAYRRDATVFFAGNGGSASTASHFACDLGKGTIRPDCRRFRAISLADNTELITAWANDVSYEGVFAEQLINLMRAGDVLVVISASGNSANIVRTVEVAREGGLCTIGLLGFDGGKLKALVDIPIVVECRDYGQVESIHLTLHHLICEHLKAVVGKEE